MARLLAAQITPGCVAETGLARERLWLSVRWKMMPLPCKPDSVRPLRDWTAISLTPPKRRAPLARGATITRGLWRAGSPAPVLSCTARGLPCRRCCLRRGGLLPHHFTLARTLAGRWRYDFCGTFRPVPSRSPSPIFMGRAALWCPDFPQAPLSRPQRPSGERLAKLPRHGANSKEKIHRNLVLESGAAVPHFPAPTHE